MELFSDLLLDDPQLGFFAHFLFRSPENLLKSYPQDSRIISAQVFHQGNLLGEESDLIWQSVIQGMMIENAPPEIGLLCVPRLDCSQARIGKCLARGGFGIAWLGSLEEKKVVFKELVSSSEIQQKEFLNEVLMMNQFHCRYLISLLGIALRSPSLIESSRESVANSNVSAMDKQGGLLMCLEFAPLGDLSKSHQILRNCSLRVKLKIALDLARGLESLHSSHQGIHGE